MTLAQTKRLKAKTLLKHEVWFKHKDGKEKSNRWNVGKVVGEVSLITVSTNTLCTRFAFHQG
jgi:hypothetical protein